MTFLRFDRGPVTVNGVDMPVRKVLVEGPPVDLGLVVAGLVMGVTAGMAGALVAGLSTQSSSRCPTTSRAPFA